MIARNGPRATLRSIQYGTDNLGIVRGISDSVVFGSYTYTYDQLSRLTGGSGPNYNGGYGYTYDAWGNTLTHTPAGGLTIPPSNPDQNNRLTGIFQYDPSGNITLPASNSNGILTPLTHTYSSDAENRIYVVDGTTQYLYDPEGHRVATKTSGSVTNEYLYDFDGNLVTTLGTNKKMQRGFVYAGGQHWADYNGTTNKTEFQFSDTTGTFTTKFDQSGNALEVCYSGPFGEGLSCSGSTDYSELHFANKKRDSESGNDYFGARYYSSMMGRFMSGDSGVDQDVEDPQSWNLYGYVRNNPLTNVDPDGHDCVVQSRIDDTHESITVSSGDCKGKGTGSGQSATYVPGTVTGISVNGGNSIDIGYNSYDGQSSGVTNSRGAPAFDHPGIDGPANAAIFGQIGNQGMGAIQWFGEQMAWNVAGGLAGHGVGLAVDAFRASRAAGALAEVLAKAGSAVGNTGMKVASREVAEQAAKEWVGEGAEPIYANRGAGQQVGWKSADGTKVARFTSADTKGYINLENRTTGSNLHVRW